MSQKPIKDFIGLFLRKYKLEKGVEEQKIKNQWSSIVGDALSSRTEKIIFIRNTLHIHIKAGPAKHEILLLKEDIKEKIAKTKTSLKLKDIVIH